MNRTLTLLAAAVVVLSVACGGSSDGDLTPTTVAGTPTPSAAAACTPSLPLSPGTTTQTMQSGGIERTYILRVPPGYDGSARTPLVVAFHGLSQPPDVFDYQTDLGGEADRAGYLLVLPSATAFDLGSGAVTVWNVRERPGGADDGVFVQDLIARVGEQACVDANNIFAMGFSNGGGMAMLAACEQPNSFAAVGVVAGQYEGCTADVPLLAFHGTDDPIIPFEGGENPPERGGGVFPPIRRSVSEWARADGCGGLPRISKGDNDVEMSIFASCRGGANWVVLYAIIGGGHTWPGGVPLPENLVGRTTESIDASPAIFDFFQSHER